MTNIKVMVNIIYEILARGVSQMVGSTIIYNERTLFMTMPSALVERMSSLYVPGDKS